MHSVDLIAEGIPKNEMTSLPCKPIEAVCCLSGQKTLCVPLKKTVSSDFTNFDTLAAPTSKFIGINSYYALKYKWERMSSWYVDESGFQRLDRQGVRNKVIAGNYGRRWSGYATTSYKKHGSLFTKVNSGDRAVWRFEMKDVDCSDRYKLFHIWIRLNAELRTGYPRPVLENLDCSTFLIKKLGISQWLNFEKWAKPLFQGSLYQFLCYLLPSQAELKNENKPD